MRPLDGLKPDKVKGFNRRGGAKAELLLLPANYRKTYKTKSSPLCQTERTIMAMMYRWAVALFQQPAEDSPEASVLRAQKRHLLRISSSDEPCLMLIVVGLESNFSLTGSISLQVR